MRKHVMQQTPIFLQPRNSSVLDSLQISEQLLLKLIYHRICNKSLAFKTKLKLAYYESTLAESSFNVQFVQIYEASGF